MPNQRAEGQHFHGFHCDDELWSRVLALAAERGVPAAVVIRAALEAFVESQGDMS